MQSLWESPRLKFYFLLPPYTYLWRITHTLLTTKILAQVVTRKNLSRGSEIQAASVFRTRAGQHRAFRRSERYPIQGSEGRRE